MSTRRAFLRTSLAFAGAMTVPALRPLRAGIPKFDRNPFPLGVASGYPTADSVVLWTRLAPSAREPGGGMPPVVVPVRWELAADDRMRKIVRAGTEYATPDWAHSVHAEPYGLEPARDYWYRFTVGNAQSVIGRTRTAPAPHVDLDRLRIAVASCQHYEHGFFGAYRNMAADRLDLIVHVGDYIYEATGGENLVRSHESPECYTLDDYRARYALYKSDPELAAAHALCPWLVTWDDHEVDNDYADRSSYENDDPELFLQRRAAAYRAYYEHMPLPRRAVPFGPHMRLYARRAFGGLVNLFMLDQRQYRSPEACPPPGRAGGNRVSDCAELDIPTRTMLGERQESWLLAGLGNSRAHWNLLAQGTLMTYCDELPGPGTRFWTDGWSGYPASRKRIIDFLTAREMRNAVVLSGDVHAFMVNRLGTVASELVTTSISSQGKDQKDLDVWRKENPDIQLADGEHRGYLRLDVSRARVVADLVAVDSVRTPASRARTLRSFVIEPGQPGPQPT